MSYLSYQEYLSYGGHLNESAFSSYLYEVETKLNYLTDNRIAQLSTIPEAVKRLEFKLISIYYNLGGSDSNSSINILKQLSSYSNGIESFGYANDSSSVAGSTSIDRRILTITKEYLSGYPELLYRGRKQWTQE